MITRPPTVAALAAAIAIAASAPAPAATFDPHQLSDLVFWVDAGQGVTESAGNVSAWADQSTAGNHLAQGTSAYQPSVASGVVNGLDAISFSTNGSGAGDNEFLSTSGLQLDATSTVFFVMSPDTLPANNAQRFAGHYGDGQFRFVNGEPGMFRGGGDSTLASPDAVAGQFQIFTYRLNSNIQQSINSSPLTTTFGSSPSISSSDFLLGGVPNTFAAPAGAYGSFDGDFAEVIVYDRALSDEEVGYVGSYLAHKYNLAASFVGAYERRVVYDFETPTGSGYPGTVIDGQDGWVDVIGNDQLTVRSDDTGIDGSNMGFAPSVTVDGAVARQNDGSFGFEIPDGSTFLIEFDGRIGNTRNAEIGLVDATNTPIIQFGAEGATLDAWRVRGPGGDTTSTDLFPAVGSDYWHLMLRVDLAAYGGDGAVSLFVADLNGVEGPAVLTAVAGMQNINLGLGSLNGSDLTGLYFRAIGGGGVDNITLTFAIPTPAALPAGLALLGLAAGRRRRA